MVISVCMDLWQVIKVAFIEHFVFAWQIFNSTDSLSSASQPNLKQLILWVLRWKIELHSSWTTSIFKIVISAKYGIDRNNQAFCPLWNISTWSHCLCLKWYHDPLQIGRQYRYTFQEVRGVNEILQSLKSWGTFSIASSKFEALILMHRRCFLWWWFIHEHHHWLTDWWYWLEWRQRLPEFF